MRRINGRDDRSRRGKISQVGRERWTSMMAIGMRKEDIRAHILEASVTVFVDG